MDKYYSSVYPHYSAAKLQLFFDMRKDLQQDNTTLFRLSATKMCDFVIVV